MKIKVALSIDIFETFTYEFRGEPGDIYPGLRVIVPFGNRFISGWVISKDSDYSGRVKNIIGVVKDHYKPSIKFMEFVNRVSNEFFVSAGKLLDSSLSPSVRSVKNIYTTIDEKKIRIDSISNVELLKISKKSEIELFYKTGISEKSLLVSDNGQKKKKSVFSRKLILNYDSSSFYNEIIKEVEKSGGSMLVVMPSRWNLPESNEIKELFSFYGSKQKGTVKNNIWLKAFSGEQVFIAGGETSLFLPFKELNRIVIEKPALFQRWKNPFSRLDPVKVAKIRAEVFGIELIENDASFTVESFLKKDLISIEDKREEKKAEVISEVLKPGEKILPARFIDYIVNDFERGKRVLVLNSRTESLDMLFCPVCKKVIRCPNCRGVLKVSKDFKASCYSCDLKNVKIDRCLKCDSKLILIKSISMESLKDSIEEKIGVGKINVISEDLLDSGYNNPEVLNKMITISSPEIVTKISEEVFDRIYFIKPESFININEFNGSEMLFSLIWNLKSLIIPNGTITVISVFHFHYMLKLINSENDYFERELKYRSFFLLPPYKNIFGIEIKSGDIRSLGSRMRKIYTIYSDKLNISKIYIKSRKKVRGKYHGFIELHTSGQEIIDSGIIEKRDIVLKSIIL